MVVVLHRKHQVIMEGVDLGDIQAVTLEVEVGDQAMVEEKDKVVDIQAVALEVKVGDQITVAKKDRGQVTVEEKDKVEEEAKEREVATQAKAVERRVRKTATTKKAVKVRRAGLAKGVEVDMATRVELVREGLAKEEELGTVTKVDLVRAGLAKEAAGLVTASETSLAVSKACSPNPSSTNCTAPEIFMPCKSLIKIFVTHADLVQLHQHSWRWRMGL
jgi:hypothetical protein